jgi:hypothetical protein
MSSESRAPIHHSLVPYSLTNHSLRVCSPMIQSPFTIHRSSEWESELCRFARDSVVNARSQYVHSLFYTVHCMRCRCSRNPHMWHVHAQFSHNLCVQHWYCCRAIPFAMLYMPDYEADAQAITSTLSLSATTVAASSYAQNTVHLKSMSKPVNTMQQCRVAFDHRNPCQHSCPQTVSQRETRTTSNCHAQTNTSASCCRLACIQTRRHAQALGCMHMTAPFA